MARAKTTELQKLTDLEINQQIDDLRRDLFDLRFQKATSQLSNTHRFKEARIKLAQLMTVKNERSRSQASS